MTKPRWFTESIRVNPKTRKAVGIQTRIPLTLDEWVRLMAWLEDHKHELTGQEPA